MTRPVPRTRRVRCNLDAIFALAERLRPEIEAWPEWLRRECDRVLDVPPFDRRARARAVETHSPQRPTARGGDPPGTWYAPPLAPHLEDIRELGEEIERAEESASARGDRLERAEGIIRAEREAAAKAAATARAEIERLEAVIKGASSEIRQYQSAIWDATNALGYQASTSYQGEAVRLRDRALETRREVEKLERIVIGLAAKVALGS